MAKDASQRRALIASTQIALNEKDFESAQKYISQLKQDEESIVDAYVLQGDMAIVQGSHQNAVKSYEQALAKIQNVNIIVKLAEAYKLSGDEKKSIAIVEDWLADHPDDTAASLYLGTSYQSSTRESEAISHYENTLKINPENVIALNNLAWLYLESDPDKALSLARKAYELVPNRPEVMDTLGWVLVQNGKIEEGLSYLEPARKESGIPDIRYHYAAGLEKAGDKGRAKQELTALLEEHGSVQQAMAAKR